MKKFKKNIIAAIVGVAAVFCVPGMAIAATNETDYFDSPNLTTNQWWSGYDNDQFHNITSSYKEVYDGDVGVWFYAPSAGVTSNLVRDTSRRVTIELKENDPGDDLNELVHTYIGVFGIDSKNRYTVTGFIKPKADNECIEQNNVVELYLRFKVDKLSKDGTSNVNRGIMRYKLWAN